MKRKFGRAPEKLFDQFSSYFPYSTVDVIIRHKGAFLLAKRKIPPYKNKWNLPGSIVFKTERLSSTAKRAAKNEIGLTIKIEKFLGVYENPVHQRHDISHVFLASIIRGKIRPDFQSSQIKFFKKIPHDMVPYQKKMLRDAGVVARN